MTDAGGRARRAFTAFLDHLFLWRPVLLTPVWAAFLFGIRSAEVHDGAPDPVPAWRVFPEGNAWPALLAVTLLTASLYIVNQVVDVDVDRRNAKLFILPRGLVTRRAALFHAAMLAAATALLAWLRISPAGAILLALAAVTGILYSVPPVRLKARAGFDALANGACYGGFTFLAGWCAARLAAPGAVPGAVTGLSRDAGLLFPGSAVVAALPYVLASAALVLLSTLEDEPGDRALGLATSAVRWGPRGVRAATLVLATLATVAALAAREWPALAWGVVAVPLYVDVLRRGGGPGRGFRCNQLAGRLLVLLAAPGALALVPLIAILVVASRAYYRRRFGLLYPRLTLEAGAVAGAGAR